MSAIHRISRREAARPASRASSAIRPAAREVWVIDNISFVANSVLRTFTLSATPDLETLRVSFNLAAVPHGSMAVVGRLVTLGWTPKTADNGSLGYVQVEAQYRQALNVSTATDAASAVMDSVIAQQLEAAVPVFVPDVAWML